MTLDEAQQGLTALEAILAAARGKLANIAADETAANDVLDFAVLIDPAALPVALAAPVVEAIANWIVAHSTQGTPDAPAPPMPSGRRGSDPWIAP